MLNVGLYDPPFAPHEGQKASKSSRSRNEGIPEVSAKRHARASLPGTLTQQCDKHGNNMSEDAPDQEAVVSVASRAD